MNSLLLPSNKLQNMIYQLHVELMISKHYENVHVPVLKSVAWVTSQYFYSSLEGMLDLHEVTPPFPPTLNVQVPN